MIADMNELLIWTGTDNVLFRDRSWNSVKDVTQLRIMREVYVPRLAI